MSAAPLQLLIVADNPARCETIRRSYATAGAPVEIECLGTLREFREHARQRPPDVALLDLNLSDGRAWEALVQPPEDGPCPILVLTAHDDPELAEAALKAGALDCVVTSPEALAVLPRTVAQARREWILRQKHRRAEAALQESEARARSVLNASPDGIVILDAAGTILMASPKALDLTGLPSAGDLIGRRITDFLVPEDHPRALADLADLFQGQPRGLLEYRANQADGRTLDLEATAACIPAAADRPAQLVVIVRDVTARKQTEAQMARQMDELRRWQTVTLGREGRIAELKREVNALTVRLGQPPPYLDPESDSGKEPG